MKRFVQGNSRTQSILLPECLADYIPDTNPLRVIDAFVDELELGELGFHGVEPTVTDRPSYHPEVILKIYVYGYQRTQDDDFAVEVTGVEQPIDFYLLTHCVLALVKTRA
jgi:hypothetical protein